jgi:hypothetical protein
MTRAIDNHSDTMCPALCLDARRAATRNPVLSLVLCPCALHALEHQQPVDCRCSAGAAEVVRAASPELQRAAPQPPESWASNPAFEQDLGEDTEEDAAEAQHPAAGIAAGTGEALQQAQQSRPPEPQGSWVSNLAFQEAPQDDDSGEEWDIIDGHVRLRCVRKPAFKSHF